MNRTAKVYLLAVDAAERRILMEMPDGALAGVEKVKFAFGKEARVIAYQSERKQPSAVGASQPKRN